MMLIGKTANWLLRHSVQRCVKSRRLVCAHARNHVICLRWPKCLIAVVLADVDLPYWTSKVEHLVAFAAIVSNICTAHAQKRLYMHRRSIRRSRFLIRVLNFGDLATFYVDFLHVIFRMSAIFLLPVCLIYWHRKYTTRVDNSNQVDMTIHCRVTAFLSADTSRDLVTLTFWPWTVVIHGGSRDQPCHHVWRPYDYELRVITVPIDYPRKCVSRGSKRLHIWNPRPRFAYSLYNFSWATTTIKGRLLSSVTNAKALDCINFLCVTLWPWPLTFWSLTVTTHGGSRGRPCHQVWRPYDYSFTSYEL